MDLETLLEQRFGFSSFRPGQEEIVSHVANGGDALVVMPTGAGKSLCYQVPALARGGMAVVVSPLIALMKDQVDALVTRGVRATYLNSSLGTAEYRSRSEAVRRGEVEILYVAPERFSPSFLSFLQNVDIRLLAVDEAHCLSQWGHDFRPDYLRLGKIREALGFPPTLALTATATPEVQKDIVDTLGIGKGRVFVRGFDRDNLLLEVVEVAGRKEKDELLADLVLPGPSLVYASTRKNVERATQALRAAGVRAGFYHAGLSTEDRTRIQDEFMEGRVPVVVATNAFGMGIDKRDIRCIVHYDMPGTIEAYYQEIGRAGRDGRMSRAVMLHEGSDRRIHEFFIDNAHPPAAWVQRVYRWLQQQADNPIYATIEEMAVALPDEAGDRAVSSCLYMLQREGLIRRIAPSDRAAWLRITPEPPKVEPAGLRGRIWQMLRARDLDPGDSLEFHPDAWAEEAGITRDQLHAVFGGLEERGYLVYRAADRRGGVELLAPEQAFNIDEKRIRDRRSREYSKLDRMENYIRGGCRRRYIIEYFGEQAPFESCGTCDICREGRPPDQTAHLLSPEQEVIVLKTLSCIARMQIQSKKTGFSADLIARVLLGHRNDAITGFGFDQLSTFGALNRVSEGEEQPRVRWTTGELHDLISALVVAECVVETYVSRSVAGKERTYKEFSLAERAWRVMKREETDFRMVFPHRQKLERPRPKISVAPGVSTELFAGLRDVRSKIAEKEGVPAYVVASNKTLEEMARLRPATRRAMLAVYGMGEQRFAKYGSQFLEALRLWATR